MHTRAVKSLQELAYYNCGDWVESCAALVEYENGQLELVAFDEEASAQFVVAAAAA